MFLSVIAVKSFCLVGPAGLCSDLPLPIARLHEFVLGMGIGLLAKKGWLIRHSFWAPVSLMLVLFCFLAFAKRVSEPEPIIFFVITFADEIILLLILITIASVAARDISGRKTVFSGRNIVRLGELSFNFYLVHATVMYIFVSVFSELEVTWVNLFWYPVILGCGLLLALVLHVWVEKPFELRIRSFADRRSFKAG